MATTQQRYEAMQRRDVKRMTRAELEELSALLESVRASVEEAIKYERTSTRHPVALRHEEEAERRFDDAILYFAGIRSRAPIGPTMNSAGELS